MKWAENKQLHLLLIKTFLDCGNLPSDRWSCNYALIGQNKNKEKGHNFRTSCIFKEVIDQ